MIEKFSRRGLIKAAVFGVCVVGMMLTNLKESAAQDGPNQIRWRYSFTLPSVPFYIDGLPLDHDALNAYAKQRFGKTATSYLERNIAHGWRIKYLRGNEWVISRIDMLEASQYVGERRFGKRIFNYGCGFRTWSGNSWFGIYIIRRI